ncbi:cell wall metabolism sensor histidine kinase WalK [Paenibacillus sp. FJAT-26967]|uniref:sensor histidine kinase n=1 Tax=Paenibacillus sp. FJAT-26967 TaxID=1729690 RepID=UPI0008399C02|nr:HAMP domain-containing sensor histidine kinase [Paenibacillus sp. FJAT-26967]
MSLKFRFALLQTSLLFLILLGVNFFIYYLFIENNSRNETQSIERKAAKLLLQENIIQHPEYWENPFLLKDFLVANELIRLIGPDSTVQKEIYTDETLLQRPAKYIPSTAPTSKLVSTDNGFCLYVQTPVIEDERQIATLEIARKLVILNDNVQVLFLALFYTTLGALVLSIIFGYIYSTLVFNPIHRLAQTMESIQKSGTFKRLEVKSSRSKDEIAQLGHTFNEMIGRLEQHFDQQKQFLADASHELRTPLTIIESYARLLQRWASNDPQLREEAIEAILSESVRLRELTKSLLTIADSDERQRVDWKEFEMRPLLQATAASIQLTFDREVKLQLPDNGSKMKMIGDPEKIKQLLIILLDNAVKYSQKPIQIHAQDEVRSIRIAVIDEGIGIDKEDIPRLFDRFYRVDKARSRKNGGVGLGLAIAESIVKLHAGTLTVQSEIGEGTQVEIKLPKG